MSDTPRRALLLCAGEGTRLRPLTDSLPKCLMPIGGRPLIDIWLQQLAEAGVEDILVNTHHHAELVCEHVRSGPYRSVVTLAHEDRLLGTAGTLARHADRFDGTFLLSHADNLSVFDLDAFVRRHAERAATTCLTMMTFETDRPETCGIVEIDADGAVVDFHEKVAEPPGRLANGAVFMAEPEVARLASGLGPSPLDFSAAVIPRLLGRVQTFHNDVYHRDVGSPASLARAQLEYPLALASVGRAPSPLWDSADLRRLFAASVASAYPAESVRL